MSEIEGPSPRPEIPPEVTTEEASPVARDRDLGGDAALDEVERVVPPEDEPPRLVDDEVDDVEVVVPPEEGPGRPAVDGDAAPGEVASTPERVEPVAEGRVEQPEGGTIVSGDPGGRAELWQRQGELGPEVSGTCALAATAGVMSDMGHPVTEGEVYEHARAMGAAQPDGGASAREVAAIQTDLGLPAEASAHHTIPEMATLVEDGHGVIASVDAGELWGDDSYSAVAPSEVNHAVWVTGIERDDATGEVTAVRVNDTGIPDGADVRHDRAAFEAAWEDRGGVLVVTEATRPLPDPAPLEGDR